MHAHLAPAHHGTPHPKTTHTGRVLLLTNPVAAGYTQNPISVYYCYAKAAQGGGGGGEAAGGEEDALVAAIAEVCVRALSSSSGGGGGGGGDDLG